MCDVKAPTSDFDLNQRFSLESCIMSMNCNRNTIEINITDRISNTLRIENSSSLIKHTNTLAVDLFH